MLPEAIQERFKSRFAVVGTVPVGGGCINDCYHLKTSAGNFFLKLNSANSLPGMFKAEAKGLQLLANAGAIRVPEVIEEGKVNDTAYLLLEWIDKGSTRRDSMYNFGRQLAALHRQSAAQFGFDNNNYIGSLHQYNQWHKAWPDFFIAMRLQPLLKLGQDRHLIEASLIGDFEKLFTKLPELFPIEAPALLHGDLWTGNYLLDAQGEAVIVDPAVYYGHREMDIAMTRLFGGFNGDFYRGYNEAFALQKGWEQRVDLCNLYPLLVHINLFGTSYLGQLTAALKRYI